MTSEISTYKRFSSICFVIFAIFLAFSLKLNASEPVEHSLEETQAVVVDGHHSAAHALKEHDPNAPVDIAAVAFEHILDAHSWHLFGDGEYAVAIPLPVILYSSTKGLQVFSSAKFNHGHSDYNGYRIVDEEIKSADVAESIYDFSITKNVAQLFLSAIILFLLFTSVARAYKKQGITSAPKGKQSFLEPLVVFVRDDLAKENIGPKSEKFVPYLLTVFFLILINNVMGLIPFSANLTGNIAFTLVLSIFTFVITNINGNKHYWSHIFLPHAPKAIWPILIPIEVFGILTKPFALMIRLFANIAAGHIIIISLVGLIFIFKSIYIAPVSVAFSLFIDILEVLVAFFQAYIFTMLSSLFIGAAVAVPHDDGAHNSDDEHAIAKH